MAQFRHLLIFGVAALLTLGSNVSSVIAASLRGCTSLEIASGGCPSKPDINASLDNDGVTLGGSMTFPGNAGPGSLGAESSDPGSSGIGAGNSGVGTQLPGTVRPGPPTPRRDNYTVTAPVTLSDLVNFRPRPGVDRMEPNGWMIVGLDTNFYAVVGVQVQDGQLLGRPASVRFTPVRYRWRYGDGTGADLLTKGGTWASQGIREFEKTPTSHSYGNAGTYFIDLTIDFAAEYRYADGGWTPITGTIPVPANRLVAAAGGAKTVLVQRECTLRSPGPGC
ncbi:MAG: PKD domain-containing protein [Lacisediminihabitans sp.]